MRPARFMWDFAHATRFVNVACLPLGNRWAISSGVRAKWIARASSVSCPVRSPLARSRRTGSITVWKSGIAILRDLASTGGLLSSPPRACLPRTRRLQVGSPCLPVRRLLRRQVSDLAASSAPCDGTRSPGLRLYAVRTLAPDFLAATDLYDRFTLFKKCNCVRESALEQGLEAGVGHVAGREPQHLWRAPEAAYQIDKILVFREHHNLGVARATKDLWIFSFA